MRGTRSKLAVIVALATAAILPSHAFAAEAVTDGGFESGGTPAWTFFQAGVCSPAACPGEAAASGARWLGLGGGTASMGNENLISQASQTVTITPPATLRLMLRITPGQVATGNFTVFMDNNVQVAQVSQADPSFSSYKQLTVSLDAFSGTHTLKLHTQSNGFGNQNHARFQVDDVSILDAAMPPTDPTPTPTPDPTDPTPTPTPTPDPGPVAGVTCKGKVATKVGTDAAELLEGTAGADVIVAGGGNDVVRAGAGDDTVCGGAGNDEIKGAAGTDRLFGDEGRDKLDGGGGKGDRCVGGPSRDTASSSCEKSKTLKAI